MNLNLLTANFNLQWMEFVSTAFSPKDGMVSCQSYCIVV